jgi:hypothetical protein
MEKTALITAVATPKTNNHDDFFRAACSKRFIVEPLLRHFIESDLSEKFDYDTLKFCPDSYITPELAHYYADRVWSIDFKNAEAILNLLLLFEHKSFIPKRVHIQLLRYMVEEWTKQIEEQLEALLALKKKGQKKREKIKLVLILPIILYHGKRRWQNPRFEDLFGEIPAVLKRFLPDFDFILIDLSKYSDQQIIDTEAGLLVNMLLLMRHSFDSAYLAKNVELLLRGFEDYDPESEYWNFVHSFFVYFLKLFKNNSMEKAAVATTIEKKRTQRGFYSMYDALVDENMQKGLEKGLEKGVLKKARLTVLRGKWKGATADYLADLSELPYPDVEKMLEDYNKVYQSWLGKTEPKVTHLSKEEVSYLINLFGQTPK